LARDTTLEVAGQFEAVIVPSNATGIKQKNACLIGPWSVTEHKTGTDLFLEKTPGLFPAYYSQFTQIHYTNTRN